MWLLEAPLLLEPVKGRTQALTNGDVRVDDPGVSEKANGQTYW